MKVNALFLALWLCHSLVKADIESQIHSDDTKQKQQNSRTQGHYDDLYKHPSIQKGEKKRTKRNLSGKNSRFIVKYKDGSKELVEKIKSASIAEEGNVANFNVSGRKLTEEEIYNKLLLRDNAEVVTVNSNDELLALENNDSVEYVEEDTKVYLQQIEGDNVPYGINLVNALQIPDSDVANRKVCIIDSGYDASHEDLPSADTGSTVTGTEGGAGPWDSDVDGHGTHVAGTIAAVANGKGVVGVNRNGQLNLHIVRVFNNGGYWAWTSTLIAAVEACVDAEANIVNMSLGGGGASETERTAYKRIFEEDGVLLIAAAGNDGNTAYSYPASYGSVLSVAAVNSSKNIASFSQRNDQVDIAAPGVGVRSTLPGNRYGSYSGTSMATPHVSGVAALVWSRFPDKTAKEIWVALTASAEDLGPEGLDNAYGHGLVRADRAVAYLNGELTVVPTIAPTSEPQIPCEDDPIGWHASDGEAYNCQLYALGNYCERYGDDYPGVGGKTANEACCACGGGRLLEVSPTAPPNSEVAPSSSPLASPSARPTVAPSVVPTPEPQGPCEDDPIGWHDADGEVFNCEYYSLGDNCVRYGDGYAGVEGKTANEACCVCGGGVSLEVLPSSSPNFAPSSSPSASSTSSPSMMFSPPPSSSPSSAPSNYPTGGVSLAPSISSDSPSKSPVVEEVSSSPTDVNESPTWDNVELAGIWLGIGSNYQYDDEITLVEWDVTTEDDVNNFVKQFDDTDNPIIMWQRQGDDGPLWCHRAKFIFQNVDADTGSTPLGFVISTKNFLASIGWLRPQSPIDLGDEAMPRGWYDAQGTGRNLDYGRYVGNAGSLYWSVALAGSTDEYSASDEYNQPSTDVLRFMHDPLPGGTVRVRTDKWWETFILETESPSISPSSVPTEPAHSPSPAPTKISFPPQEYTCSDYPLYWHDSDSSFFNCRWYAKDNNCDYYGHKYRGVDDKTANEACCACGGGLVGGPPVNSPTSQCVDSPENWHGVLGQSFNCQYYVENDKCSYWHGNWFAGVNGKTVREACCGCGGGSG